MDSWVLGKQAEGNAALLRELEKDLKTIAMGDQHHFFEVSADWRCPCCHRSKEEFARRDKNHKLLCALHNHHDHFGDYASTKLPGHVKNLIDSFCRFPDTLICSDCNVAEPVAKTISGAPEHFSFAPFEIATFITVRKRSGHIVRPDCAKRAYEAARPAMRLLKDRLKDVRRAAQDQDEGDTFGSIGGAAWRALKEINLARKGRP